MSTFRELVEKVKAAKSLNTTPDVDTTTDTDINISPDTEVDTSVNTDKAKKLAISSVDTSKLNKQDKAVFTLIMKGIHPSVVFKGLPLYDPETNGLVKVKKVDPDTNYISLTSANVEYYEPNDVYIKSDSRNVIATISIDTFKSRIYDAKKNQESIGYYTDYADVQTMQGKNEVWEEYLEDKSSEKADDEAEFTDWVKRHSSIYNLDTHSKTAQQRIKNFHDYSGGDYEYVDFNMWKGLNTGAILPFSELLKQEGVQGDIKLEWSKFIMDAYKQHLEGKNLQEAINNWLEEHKDNIYVWKFKNNLILKALEILIDKNNDPEVREELLTKLKQKEELWFKKKLSSVSLITAARIFKKEIESKKESILTEQEKSSREEDLMKLGALYGIPNLEHFRTQPFIIPATYNKRKYSSYEQAQKDGDPFAKPEQKLYIRGIGRKDSEDNVLTLRVAPQINRGRPEEMDINDIIHYVKETPINTKDPTKIRDWHNELRTTPEQAYDPINMDIYHWKEIPEPVVQQILKIVEEENPIDFFRVSKIYEDAKNTNNLNIPIILKALNAYNSNENKHISIRLMQNKGQGRQYYAGKYYYPRHNSSSI